MGGRGGGGKNPYGEPNKLYKFTLEVYKDGIKQSTGEILSNGGSEPSWFTKEVGSGLFPSINWFGHGRSVSFVYHKGQYVWAVSTATVAYATTNSLNDYTLEVRVTNVQEIPNPNNHPIIKI